MKKLIVLFAFLTLVFDCSVTILAQENRQFTPVKFESRNLGGPRLGFTVVPGNNELATNLKEQKVGRVLSQFGWHFEYQIVPNIEGPCFIIEFVPLVAGVEYGKLIPSTTLAFGIRFPNGIEFGMGPNVMATTKNVTSALMIAAGKSFSFGGVSIPLNLAFTTNPKGYRISFIFGYAIERGS